jgi:uncharacterized protein (DUF305 family)
MKMIPPLACAALSVALLTAIPVSAQPSDPMASAKCSEAGMKSANESMMKMTDATKKAEVMKEMHTAKGMMAKKDEKGCVTHMEKAMGMMTGMGMMMDMQMMAPNANDSTSTKGYKAAMMKAMEGRPMMKFTGDADFDFMSHMRSHHQGAVNMAKVVLANGKDSEVRKLAQDIVTAQEKEMVAIDAWLRAKGNSN